MEHLTVLSPEAVPFDIIYDIIYQGHIYDIIYPGHDIIYIIKTMISYMISYACQKL